MSYAAAQKCLVTLRPKVRTQSKQSSCKKLTTQTMKRFCSHCSLEYATLDCRCRVEAYCSKACQNKAKPTHAVQCQMYRDDPCVFFEHRHRERIAKLTAVFSSPVTVPPKYMLFREVMVEGKMETFVTHYYTHEFIVLLGAEVDQEVLMKALKIHDEYKNAMTFIVHSEKHPKYRIWLKTVNRESETVVKIVQTQDLGKRKQQQEEKEKKEKTIFTSHSS